MEVPRHLPCWAQAYFRREFDSYHHSEVLEHRATAFDRLFSDLRLAGFWSRADRQFSHSQLSDLLINGLILATDAAAGSGLFSDRAVHSRGWSRLRSPVATRARKLALLVTQLAWFSPPRLKESPAMQSRGSIIELLVVCFGFDMPKLNFEEEASRLQIRYRAADIKAGEIERYRLHERLRPEAIRLARDLAAATHHSAFKQRLLNLADDLGEMETLRDARRRDPSLRSNKHGWIDWLRQAQRNLDWLLDHELSFIRNEDWATIASVLFRVDIDADQVAHALATSRRQNAVQGLANY